MKIPLVKYVGEGERFPRGYGLAWRCWDRREAGTLPVPLNLVARFLRKVWISVRCPDLSPWEEQEGTLWAKAFQDGLAVGQRRTLWTVARALETSPEALEQWVSQRLGTSRDPEGG